MCLTLADKTNANTRTSFDGSVLVADGIDPSIDHSSSVFRGLSAPRGNSTVGFTSDVYGISEAWLRIPGAPEVYRAQVHPARRPATGDFKGNAWSIQAQNAAGAWSPVFAMGSASQANDLIDPATAEASVPQLMPLGRSNPQMFACAGERSQDNAVPTTWLLEVMAPNAAKGRQGGVTFIQDLLNGDDRFVRNAPGPLIGPANPPTPTVRGPGNPVRQGSVQCAMTQLEDDIATRQLHMLTVQGGRLYYSTASNFGPATTGDGGIINRFSSVSLWKDLSQELGVNFGNIVSATVIASRPTAISIFFVAESGGRYRLWHAVRFSSGSWRPAEDVLALSGDAPGGTVYSWQVAAGVCPTFGAADWTEQNSEILVVLRGGPNRTEVVMVRVVPTPRQWTPTAFGIYSPLRSLGTLLRSVDPSRNPVLQNVVVTVRPFRDNGTP